MSVGSPLLVLASETTYPIDTSKYLKVPNLLALASKKWYGRYSSLDGS